MDHSRTNDLILNFKKSIAKKALPEWKYNGSARKGRSDRQQKRSEISLGASELNGMAFVPIPPSKMKDDPLYDDRVTQMLNSIRPETPLDVREVIVQTESVCASHGMDDRPRPDEIRALYWIDEELVHRHRRMIHPNRLQEFENICRFHIFVNAPNESVH